MTPETLFAAFIAMGLILIVLEIIVPGGILGVFGVLALLGAVVIGFIAFGPQGGLLAAFGVLFFSAIFLALWLKYFPRTRMGRVLTLQKDGSAFKTDPVAASPLLGREGVAASNLQLSGIAIIDGRRTDVVAESNFIAAGARVKVVKVEGHRVVVREVAAS
ncbi:MAG TPA: NfeD family protein [Kiritimatiellia bacterium]|nr:NfeD family protein [Kiritimatiellia bacterium]